MRREEPWAGPDLQWAGLGVEQEFGIYLVGGAWSGTRMMNGWGLEVW